MINRRVFNSIGAAAAGALAFTMVPSPASAQTQTETSQSAATTTPAPAKKKPTSATPQMIDEAIQRSQARAAKAAATGQPELFGSEEPFTYVPGRTN